jgi:hypothetical protein
MTSIDRTTRPQTARREQVSAAQIRLRWGARWLSSFRGDSPNDLQSQVRPEDLARSELFYNSTCCWV